jgi:hypothetical protein
MDPLGIPASHGSDVPGTVTVAARVVQAISNRIRLVEVLFMMFFGFGFGWLNSAQRIHLCQALAELKCLGIEIKSDSVRIISGAP